MYYFLYILKSPKKNQFYVGQTNNIERRLQRHNCRQVLSTKSGAPWLLVYVEKCNSRTGAVKKETYFKSQKSRKFIEQIINRRGVEQ